MSDFAPQVDLLTGAYKRAFFEELLAKAVQSAHKQGRPLTLLYVDVDEVRERLDVHGSPSVDQGLALVASRLSDVLDGRGPLGRVGPDEFAAILPGLSQEEGRALAETFRRLVRMTLHASAFGDYRLTVSVGVASLRPREPWGNLFDAAESASIRAKQQGRDAVATR